ncbi:MAG: hypothetical protein ACJ8AT_14060 [Hyalangium sp.]|uniref:hypothetical protein n=1 Tax=Hyalangium sp. TaxID=2028555 RepID=UPI00389AFDBC
MEWINEPPCHAMTLKLSDPTTGKLELIGPAPSARVGGGLVAAMGATFGSVALPFLRLPFPAPFKLIPLTLGLVGGGMGAAGLAFATANASVLFERGKGVRFRWKLATRPQKELFIPVKDIAGIDISRGEHAVKDSSGFTSTRYHYGLHVVTTEGKAVQFESFSLQTQARLRKEQIEAVLRPVEVERKRGNKPARKKTAAKSTGASKKTTARKSPPARKAATARKTTRAEHTR